MGWYLIPFGHLAAHNLESSFKGDLIFLSSLLFHQNHHYPRFDKYTQASWVEQKQEVQRLLPTQSRQKVRSSIYRFMSDQVQIG